MLLTISWFLIIIAGRVDLDPETSQPHYTIPKLDPPDNFSFYGTGVGVPAEARIAAYIVMATAVPYLVIEGAALAYKSDTDDVVAYKEKPYAIITLMLAFTGFFAYLLHSYFSSSTSEVTKIGLDEYLTDGIKSGKITLVAAVAGIMDANKHSKPGLKNGGKRFQANLPLMSPRICIHSLQEQLDHNTHDSSFHVFPNIFSRRDVEN
jgi:hypothetical protein